MTQDGDERQQQHRHGKKDAAGSDNDSEALSEFGDEHNEEEENEDRQAEKTTKKSEVLPNVSAVSIKD